jgi:hypothetical protein
MSAKKDKKKYNQIINDENSNEYEFLHKNIIINSEQ